MVSITLYIICIAVLVAYAASLPGTLLVLRGTALLSDAISHSVLLGIAVMFLVVQSLNSVWLFIGATVAGLATVVLTEAIVQADRLKHDAAIGVVFPFFFSVGVLLISVYARNVHLDIDMVVLGEIAFAPFYRLIIGGYDLGPYALWTASGISIVNTLCIWGLFKEFKVVLFDSDFAYVTGFRPTLLYYVLMTLTSITAVGSFEIVGSIVVVALMVTPAASAYLLVRRFGPLLVTSASFSVVSALLGYAIARIADVSIAGSIAAATGILFCIVLLCAPQNGVISRLMALRRSRYRIAQRLMQTYLRSCSKETATHDALADAFVWDKSFVTSVAHEGAQAGVFEVHDDTVTLKR